MFDDDFQDVHNPIRFIKFKTLQFNEIHKFERNNGIVKAKEWRMIGWDCPPQDWCKINSDGAFKVREGVPAAGGLLRDSNGKWMAWFVANLGNCSAMVAEIWGASYALQLAWKRNVKKLILELDSLLVVQLIKNGHKSINMASSIIMEIR